MELNHLDERPDTLWHYTDANGLLGILKNQRSGSSGYFPKFWATAIEYLNDHRELTFGLEYLKLRILELVDRLEKTTYEDDEPHIIVNIPGKVEFLRSICVTIDKVVERTYPIHIHCYTTSFSRCGDVLSQWRAYGSGTNGFSIGIDAAKLPRPDLGHPLRPGPQLAKVEYGHSLPQDFTEDLYKRLSGFLNRTEPPSTSDGMMDQQLAWMASIAARIKHQGFEEEEEWRYITSRFDGLCHRASATGLVPYVTWGLEPEAIVGLKVGPGPMQEENRRSAQSLLQELGYTAAASNIEKSRTPFR
ncbi:DUF2971 domain-containing protein [Nocardia terpenica]|uniref:DUF2971 domain-containing protein n=1 Tax=Nocardia terpenica TaxID=455432 RepID=UPI0018961475|nr:DUF2971 domain-containing protein [Nocardia terpenica]MBF6063042.1 DUF2971 domain-containing protein [Nocardia terpenica]MBF6104823.1 DUF2971 domain-containing protein [Nocardia terpenica]MBF6112741.1 DUF2971 domain-containing protein [Nocardia terpenica]MBF6118551.1 DUF2971 domain-containing protein [Nocardia terpenica]MBF6155030.1 DUF2971 domain-containing protein [Nocardia terpenica]